MGMLYTTLKPFVFRGLRFNPGDPFDPVSMQCDTHRAKVLMNARYLSPGYNGENKPSQPQKAQGEQSPEKSKNGPGSGHSEPSGAAEPDNNGEEPEQPEESEDSEEPRRTSTPRRRS